jgi:hypothetical protein
VTGPVNVKYSLTILSADGNKIVGKAKAEGPRGGVSEYPISGTLEGRALKYESADKDLMVELSVDGDKMTGTGLRRRANARGEFSLSRQK